MVSQKNRKDRKQTKQITEQTMVEDVLVTIKNKCNWEGKRWRGKKEKG